MKSINYLKISICVILLYSGQVSAGPLADYINKISQEVIDNLKTQTQRDRLKEYESIIGTTHEERQFFFRPRIATFLKTEKETIDQKDIFKKKALFEKLTQLYLLVADLRNHLNPAQADVELNTNQLAYYNHFNKITEDAYRGFLTLSTRILMKKDQDIIEDDIEFCESYTALKELTSKILEFSAKFLETENITDTTIPFYVYGFTNNPKPFPSLANHVSSLEQKLKETYKLIDQDEFMQQNLRSEAHFFFTEQKRLITQLKEQFNTMLQHYIQKEGINHKINYRTEEITYVSSNPLEAIENKSLQDIFHELGINRNDFVGTLLNISLNLQFAAQNILPYSIDEMADLSLDRTADTKQNRYHNLLQETATSLSGSVYALIGVLSDGDRFAQINPAHLTFYWNLLLNLEGLLGSYEKYLNISIDDDSQQNTPLFVHILNIRQ